MSNRIVLIERECTHSSIEGVDFVGKVFVLARSPEKVLIWVCGHSWSANGWQQYAGPKMYVLGRKAGVELWRQYKKIYEGRLWREPLENLAPKLIEEFGEDISPHLIQALKSPRKTVIIEGGGPILMPDRYRWHSHYEDWRKLPENERGLFVAAQPH